MNRVLVFAKNNCEGIAPKRHDLQPIDHQFLGDIQKLVDQTKKCYETFKVRRASQLIMDLAQLGNVYFDAKKPWKDAKQPETRTSLETTIACCLECLKALALVSFPIMPTTAAAVWKMLGFNETLEQWGWERVLSESFPCGQRLEEPKILFQRIEDAQIEQELAKLKKMTEKQAKENAPAVKTITTYVPLKEAIDIGDVTKLDLRVGTVTTAVAVPKSKKLLQLQVDLGFETRTIVSGIGQSYSPEQIIGKKVIVVANLKPATLMGIQSQGMLLAAGCDGIHEVANIQNLPNGSVVS